MKLIKSNPAKAWKILKVNNLYITEWNDLYRIQRDDVGWFNWEYESGDWKNRSKKYLQAEEVDNFIFEANLEYVDNRRGRSAAQFYFKDIDDENKLATGMAGMDALLKALKDGKIKMENGKYKGTFTFKKQGSEIYFYPYEEK